MTSQTFKSLVPRKRRFAQIMKLPGNKLVIRHEAGLSLIHGISEEALEDLLVHVDGRRSMSEIIQICSNRYEPEDVQRVLEYLAGDLLEIDQTASTDESGKTIESEKGVVTVLGNGPAAELLVERLEETGVVRPSLTLLKPLYSKTVEKANKIISTERDPNSVVLPLLENTSYSFLFQLQEAMLKQGVPSIFITLDSDGLRLGPLNLAGASPCFGCCQSAAFRFMGQDPATNLAMSAQLTTLELVDADNETRLKMAAGALASYLNTSQYAGPYARVLHFQNEKPKTIAIPKDGACPLCSKTPRTKITDTPKAYRDLFNRVVWEQTADPVMDLGAAPTRSDVTYCREIGVLGGGTAGYLTAMALRKKHPYLKVTLIESSKVPIIGVGEATTPLMPQFLHQDLGLDIHTFFREVQPTIKLGIRFLWSKDASDYFNYPFGGVRVLEPQLIDGHIRDCSRQSMMMSADVLPVFPESTSQMGSETAYHLDNKRFVAYLKKQAQAFGIELVDANIKEAVPTDNGDSVRELIADDGRRFQFDLYIDCSGFRSMLLEKTLGSPFISFGGSLFTDRAVAASVPHGGRLKPYTIAEAMSAGWCWNTPQMEADHRGYVYCSKFQSEDQAIDEMQKRNPGMGEPRVIHFRPGRHQHFWKGNVVAMGNAYGFVEPLESTALHMLIRQIGILTRALPVHYQDRGISEIANRQVNHYWDYLRWFLAIHFKYNRKLDTPFWRACRADVDVSAHAELIAAFQERGPLSYNKSIAQAFDYPDPLWGAEGVDVILLGQNVACGASLPDRRLNQWREWRSTTQHLLKCMAPQEQVLADLADRPDFLVGLAQAFAEVGPAFGV